MVERTDVEAALAARHELGREYEPDIVDSLVAKIEARLDERTRERPRPAPVHHPYLETRLVLGSIALGVAATAIASGHGVGGVALAIIAWLAIAIVNVAYAWRR